MEITIFSKKRTNKEGKPFNTYLSSLTKRDGTQLRVAVKFSGTQNPPSPDACPMNIIVDKEDANLASREYVRTDTGEVSIAYTLWVKHWNSGGEYVDHSLDDFV